MLAKISFDTSIGLITLVESDGAITELRFGAEPSGAAGETPLLSRAREQLLEYLAGARREFDLPLRPEGTDFQMRCWRSLCAIPYGQTISYGEQAARVGNPKACRAVGMANNRNPIPILIPCHRVIGRDGALTGYGGGLHIKELLLRLERGEGL